MKNTVIAVGLIFIVPFIIWYNIANRKVNKTMNNERVAIEQLPFEPGQATVLSKTTEGNIQTTTYEYEGKKYQEVSVVTFNEQDKKEREIIDVMAGTLVSLGIQTTNNYQTARNLCLIRQKFDWNNPAWTQLMKIAPDFIGMQSWQLKQEIYQEIQNDDADVVASILNASIPFTHPPMWDYMVRTNENGEYDEVRSVETNRLTTAQN